MKKKIRILSIFSFILTALVVIMAGIFSLSCSLGKENFVKKHGHLRVEGSQLVDKAGKPIQLKGMSYLDIEGESDYINPEFFSWLRDDWGSTVVRAAMYTEDSGYFAADRKYHKMREAIDYAIETGLYILVDWHILYDGFPAKYQDQAIEFFTMMAKEYKGCPNVIYEICNEPNGEDLMWSRDIKSYAIPVIKAIRGEDPDALIIVGSPEWDRRLDIVAESPLEFDNILYSFHFYTGSHGDDLKELLQIGLDAGLPVFISEWGTTLDSGDDGVYAKETFEWIKMVNENNLSWCNWAISVRNEDSAALKPNTPGKEGMSIYHLTESGALARSLIKGSTEDIFFADGFESENFRSGDWENDKTGISEDEFYTGYYSARFKKGSVLSRAFSTEVYSVIELNFFIKTENFGEADTFNLEWYGKGKWNKAGAISPSDGKWKEVTFSLPPEASGESDFAVRFTGDFSSDNVNVYIDDFSMKMKRKSLY